MASLTNDQVRHIAKLARLKLSDEEVPVLAEQLSGIFGYIDMLREVDTTGVEPTLQVAGLKNAFREDEIRAEPIAEPDALLATSPLPIVDHQIETPSAHG